MNIFYLEKLLNDNVGSIKNLHDDVTQNDILKQRRDTLEQL